MKLNQLKLEMYDFAIYCKRRDFHFLNSSAICNWLLIAKSRFKIAPEVNMLYLFFNSFKSYKQFAQ